MSNEESDSALPKKQSTLLTKLRRRFTFREEQPGDQEQNHDLPEMTSRGRSQPFARPGNMNAVRNKIQIGLKLSGKHIRKESTGGGKIREAHMRKSLGRAAIMNRGKQFFFPEGNRFGPAEEFTFELENFEEKLIDGRYSIGDMYESTGLPLLRFYLCATPKEDDDPVAKSNTLDEDGSSPKVSQATFKSQAGSTSMTYTATRATASTSTSGLAGSSIMSDMVTTEDVSTGMFGASSCAAGSAATVFKLSPGISVQYFLKDPHSYDFMVQGSAENLNSENLFPKSETPVSSTASTDACSPNFVDLGTPTVQAREDYLGAVVPRDKSDDVSDEEPLPIVNDLLNYVDDQGHPVALVATAANDSGPRGDSNTPVQKVKLHRGHVLKELTEFYRENYVSGTLEVEMIMPNGQREAAEDCGGVVRDALSEYWEDFYLMNTTGENVKVPCVRDNMKEEDWQACAKVLVMGYKQEGYFPYKLAQPFLKFTMDGDDTIINREHGSLLPTFLEYVPDCERELLEDALKNFSEVDKDELLDVLETYKVKRDVGADNINDILKDAAHRTLIQATAYICRCWHALFVNELRPVLRGNLADVCKQTLPTTKQVTEAIILPNTATEAEKNTGKLLLKYVRSLSSERLAAFMRYTTGANLMLGRKITVRFVQQTDFERRPLAHTCGCVLELATSFNDYIEFRSEFNAVLDAKVWVMDIV